MDGSAPESAAGLSWYYLDSVQKEFGPFAQATMREWFTQGFFPNGEELMIRLPHWERHLALKMVWPDVSEAFMGVPRSFSSGPPQMQMGEVRDSFDPYSDLQASMMGTRRPSEEQSPYLPEMAQMGGCRFWTGSHPDASASAALNNGLLGYPVHGIAMPSSASTLPGGTNDPGILAGVGGMPGELLEGMPNVPRSIPQMNSLGAMSGGMPGNMVAMPTMAGMVPGAQAASPEVMAQGCVVDGQFGNYSSGFQGQGMILQPMQPTFANPQMQLVPMSQNATGARANTRFRGRIKSFNAKQGFGFIENSEAYAIFGRDVFLHKAQIGNLKVGTEVTYSVEMNKFGMPQARDLATLDGKPPGPPPASVVKGGAKQRPAAKKKPKDEDGLNPMAKKAGGAPDNPGMGAAAVLAGQEALQRAPEFGTGHAVPEMNAR
mmetsp:Transcript_64216/g.150766  ORF Transcript_64216/g.150766 Transcript_64216/m.150766 type:complete len:432 (+) Transcript_64216:123-1418(+)